MNLPIRRTKIKDCEYAIHLLDGDAALNGLGVLAKYAGGPIGLLLGAGASTDAPELIAGALRELGSALGSPDLRDLVYRMLEGCTATAQGGKPMPLIAGGNRELFKAHFTGKPGDIVLLAWFALKENYANFFDALPGLGELAQRLRSLAQAQPQSLTGTTTA